MKKLITSLFLGLALLSVAVPAGFLFQPNVALAQSSSGSVPGQNGYYLLDFRCTGPAFNTAGPAENECTFYDFIVLTNRVVTLVLYLSFILAVVSFMYAGFLLITAGGNSSKISQARSIFWKVIIGMIIIFIAWTIVHFITQLVGLKSDYNKFMAP